MDKLYHKLLDDLKKEGSFDKYCDYLADIYGTITSGSHYSMQMDMCKTSVNEKSMEEFLEYAVPRDLQNKSLEKLYWIAEAEKEYTDQPLYRAIDHYYRINPAFYNTKEEVLQAVHQLEHSHKDRDGLLH